MQYFVLICHMKILSCATRTKKPPKNHISSTILSQIGCFSLKAQNPLNHFNTCIYVWNIIFLIKMSGLFFRNNGKSYITLLRWLTKRITFCWGEKVPTFSNSFEATHFTISNRVESTEVLQHNREEEWNSNTSDWNYLTFKAKLHILKASFAGRAPHPTPVPLKQGGRVRKVERWWRTYVQQQWITGANVSLWAWGVCKCTFINCSSGQLRNCVRVIILAQQAEITQFECTCYIAGVRFRNISIHAKTFDYQKQQTSKLNVELIRRLFKKHIPNLELLLIQHFH